MSDLPLKEKTEDFFTGLSDFARHLTHPSGQSAIKKMNDLKFNLIGLQSTSVHEKEAGVSK